MTPLNFRCWCLAVALAANGLWGNINPVFAEDARQPLPLKRVVVLNSGVGYFEHSGPIEGNRLIEFPVKVGDINDLLKSLVVQDRGGGRVTAVNYGSPEPIAQTLKGLAIDITSNPSLSHIFHQLRGQKVELANTSDAKPALGTVVGVERRRSLGQDQQVVDRDVILLRTEAGLRSIPVDSITLTRFSDEKTDRDFQTALDLLNDSRKRDIKAIKLDFRGKGPRQVSIGYVQEAPVWKTSYRLVVGKDKPPFLQGWAIVENTTAQDWSDVELTLMSGRPISFKMNLYQPLFAMRPTAEMDLHTSVAPRKYNQDLAAQEDEFLAAVRKAKQVPPANTPAPVQHGGFGGGGMGGGMGGMMGGMGGGMGFGAAPGAGVDGEARAPVDLSQGVASVANTDDIGESFRYVIKTPVSLRRNESSMLPIVNEPVQGDKVYIYNIEVHRKHPLAGLRLKNSTDVHLQQGPISVFEDDEYAGDAQIADIPPGSTRLISYAMDLDTEVVADDVPVEKKLVGLNIQAGGLIQKYHFTRKSPYLIKNSGSVPKSILIEMPIDAQWPTIEPKPTEKTRNLYRFATTAAPGKPATVVVTESKDDVEVWLLRNLELDQIELMIKSDQASPELQKSLKEIIQRRTKLIGFNSKRLEIQQSIQVEVTEQQRLRDNLKALTENEPLQQRYIKKLTESEDSLESLREKLTAAQSEENKYREDFHNFVENMSIR